MGEVPSGALPATVAAVVAGLVLVRFAVVERWYAKGAGPVLAMIFAPALAVVLYRLGDLSNTTGARVVGVACLYALVAALLSGRKRLAGRSNTLGYGPAIFGVLEVGAAIASAEVNGSIKSIGYMLVLAAPPLCAPLVLDSRLSRSSWFSLIAYCSATLALSSVALGLSNPAAFAESSESRIPILDLSIATRIAGAFNNPNGLGMICVVGLVATAAAGRAMKWRIPIAVALVVCALMTQQRTAVISMLLLAGGYAWVSISSYMARSTLSLGTVFGAIALTPQLVATNQTISSDASLGARQAVWHYVLSNLGSSAVIGWGPAGLFERTAQAGIAGGLYHAHNEFLSAWATGGLVLALVFVAVVIGLARAANHDRLVLVAVISLIPMFFFESPLETQMDPFNAGQVTLMWLLIGALSLHVAEPPPAVESDPEPAVARSDAGQSLRGRQLQEQ